jgi:hypothetical protein
MSVQFDGRTQQVDATALFMQTTIRTVWFPQV